MKRAVIAALIVLAIWSWIGPARAACTPHETIVRTNVVMDPLTVKEDYTAETLRALAGTMTQRPPHPILGFYAASTGYLFIVMPHAGDACAGFDVQVHLVLTKRLIELAADLESRPCMFQAALKHYRLHDAEEVAALSSSGRRLQTSLTAILESNRPTTRHAAENLIGKLMTRWLSGYEATLPAIRRAADTPANVAALVRACDF